MLRVLYFTIIHQRAGAYDNGGTLSSRTNILRLKQDEDIDLAVIVAAPESARIPTSALMAELGIDIFIFVPIDRRSRPERLGDRLRRAWLKPFSFSWETTALSHPEVKECITEVLTRWDRHLLMIDYLFSALFCPSLKNLKLPTAIITLNKEAESYRDCVRRGILPHGPIRATITGLRLAKFERSTYAQSAKVIAIGPPDIPKCLPSSQATCITPYLDEQLQPWRFTNSKTIFFVGNESHYPNRLAIEFIASRLAPCIAARRADVRIKIVGADAASVPTEWRHPIVDYLGVSDAATVRQLFQTADFLLCPISNDFGMKFKVAEAAAYATPFLASQETAKCIPYLAGMSEINLSEPEGAADLACSLVGNQFELERTSAFIRSRHRSFSATQKNIWSRTLLS